jgi:Uma2 family endonuclease
VLNVQNVAFSTEQFVELCADNPELVFELTAQKELVIMTRPKPKTGWRNGRIFYRLTQWAEADEKGVTCGPDTLFELPNGAMRSPDASWVWLERWDA